MSKWHYEENPEELLDFLTERKKDISPLLILTHDYPDPDALAGAYALHFLANHVFNIRARIVYKGVIGRVENRNMVNFLDLPVHKVKAREIAKYEHVVLIDTQPEFENNPFPEDRRATIIIDQHPPVNSPAADLVIIDTECGATSIILAKAILALKINIPERLATALAYGIITDTLNLYRARRPDIIETYMKILTFTDKHILARIQIPEHDKHYFNTLSRAIMKAQMKKGLMICHIGRVKAPELVAQIAEYFLCFKKSEEVLVTGRFNSKLHASLRVKNRHCHAADILRKCFEKTEDAGGHGQIAGGAVRINKPNDKKWLTEEQRIENNIVMLLKLNKSGKFYQPFR